MTTIVVAGTSVGGSGYLRRIIEAHISGNDDVTVRITAGPCQTQVCNRINYEIAMLYKATRPNFSILVEMDLS